VDSSGTASSEQKHISVQLILNKQVPHNGITMHTHVISLVCSSILGTAVH